MTYSLTKFTLLDKLKIWCVFMYFPLLITLLKLSTTCSLQHYFYDNMQNYTSNDSNVNMVVGQTTWSLPLKAKDDGKLSIFSYLWEIV